MAKKAAAKAVAAKRTSESGRRRVGTSTATNSAATRRQAAKPAAKATGAGPKKRVKKDTESCFVMSPFGGWYEQYYTDIYGPAIEAAGLKPCRADDLYRPSSIVHDIWTYVKGARVMLADLTDKNPNVFYELGLAHALDKPVVLLSQSMEDVPFDLRALRVITYEVAAPNWGDILRASITTALKEVLVAPNSAVLQPFLREASDPPQSVSATVPTDPAIQALMREVNLLRSEVLHSPRREREIGPDEARAIIARYVEDGLPQNRIIDRIAPLGPPISWIRREIAKARDGSQGTLLDE